MTTKHPIINGLETITVQELIDILQKVENKNIPVTFFTEIRVCSYLYYPLKSCTTEWANDKGYFRLEAQSLKRGKN